MNGAEATGLTEGTRMHMHHGPIDLVIGADGPAAARDIAFRAGWARFQSVLPELVVRFMVSVESERPLVNGKWMGKPIKLKTP